MDGQTTTSSTDAAAAATAELGAWVARLESAAVPAAVLDRLALVVLDVVGVAAVGARTDDQTALRLAWAAAGGPAPVFGAGQTAPVDTAAWLNASAMACLELDEGNKYAKGHPAVHGFPAVLALAAERDATGADTAAALLAAYEVAARFGRATRLRAGAHPHGNWGVAGAAAGCARLLGLGPDVCAAAIDTGAGMPVAGHFDSATTGNPVRDAWLGAANTAGLAAARMAAAGVARNTGTAALSLGSLLGAFDPGELTAELGTRWDVTAGYFKRHASCSFTHPAADAMLELADGRTVADVRVETHALGAGLSRTDWDNRLSAMFSTPFVVAAAALDGAVEPRTYADGRPADPRLRDLARHVTVVAADDLTARLPGRRAARVTVRYTDGDTRTAEVPNPVGDADHRPFDRDAVTGLLRGLLGDDPVLDRLVAFSTGFAASPRVGEALRGLAGVPATTPPDSTTPESTVAENTVAENTAPNEEE
ncbi:2-methylcitrate dehydratase PrpD [Prauserella aidingensis]|uniref:MmgE/PrpD family protein n=1 Tax=Prauserella aidingensis TaxID=387890 RepID=UPI0020A5EF2B|nr:MmgE/PrpD family protein [Prauserella aidingensis]MCP2255428.1 2-methylcitrate dehydratase PrpD [Prauserella aidingensis]